MSFRESDHLRAPRGSGIGGQFVRTLMSARVGTTTKNRHGVGIKAGVVRQGARRRRLFSVEGGGVHRSAQSAATEAEALGAPPEKYQLDGPKSYTGWLGRYRRMSLEDLYDEEMWLGGDQSDGAAPSVYAISPPVLAIRKRAVVSAIEHVKGEREVKKRPGGLKDKDAPKPVERTDLPEDLKGAVEAAQKAVKALGRSQADRDRSKKLEADIKKTRDDYYSERNQQKQNQLAIQLGELTDKLHRINAPVPPEKVTKAGAAIAEVANIIGANRRRPENERRIQKTNLNYQMMRAKTSEEKAAVQQEMYASLAATPKPTGRTRDDIYSDIEKARDAREKFLKDFRDNYDGPLHGMAYFKASEKARKKHDNLAVKLHREMALFEKRERQTKDADYDGRPTADDLREALKLVRGENFGDGKLVINGGSGGKALRDIFDTATRYLPKEWVDTMNEREVVDQIRGGYDYKTKSRKGIKVVTQQSARAHYVGHSHEILMASGTTSYSVALHEMGHAVEKTNPAILAAEKAYYDKRTRGPLTKLSTLSPGRGYRDKEVAKVGDFYDPYMGKDYRGFFYELLTMGLEGTFFNQGGMYNKDPESRNWILGLLGGF